MASKRGSEGGGDEDESRKVPKKATGKREKSEEEKEREKKEREARRRRGELAFDDFPDNQPDLWFRPVSDWDQEHVAGEYNTQY